MAGSVDPRIRRRHHGVVPEHLAVAAGVHVDLSQRHVSCVRRAALAG